MDIESLRQQFRPKKVSLLFVGESPPASGRFFYDKSHMTTFTSRAFERAFDVQFSSTAEFLEFFKSKGCFLDDVSHDPVDKLGNRERQNALQQCIEPFSRRLRDEHPDIIVVVLKKISDLVSEAVTNAGLQAPIHVLPFPGNGHQNKYIKSLEVIIRRHLGDET